MLQESNVTTENDSVSADLCTTSGHKKSKTDLTNVETKNVFTGPIKVVDMKKLLQQPPHEVEVKPNKESQFTKFTESEHTVKSTSTSNTTEKINEKHIKKYCNLIKRNIPTDASKITIYHILNCLSVILPKNFNLSNLISNEKVASLINRYFKVADSKTAQNLVVKKLDIVIGSSKLKENVFEKTDSIHPYLMICDEALKKVITFVLPQSYSINYITNDILKCICYLLKVDVFTDGYCILRQKIKKYIVEQDLQEKCHVKSTAGNIPFQDKNNSQTNVCSKKRKLIPSAGENCNIEYKSNNEQLKNVKCPAAVQLKRKIADKPKPISESSIPPTDEVDPFEEDDVEIVSDGDEEYVVKPEGNRRKIERNNQMEIKVKKPLANKTITLKNILKYLEDNNCTAQDVLNNFRLRFYLCRHLQIRTRKANVEKLETLLNLIIERNITSDLNIGDSKLKLKPVVLLRNLIDYNNGDMTFMKRVKLDKPNGCSYSSFLLDLNKNKALKKYTNNQVELLTGRSYRLFKTIVTKRNGNKLVFGIKYTKLIPETVVFVKDYQNPLVGWLRGNVKKQIGFNKYSVKLDSGDSREFVSDQLRPILSNSDPEVCNLKERPNRTIKPKQLLDL